MRAARNLSHVEIVLLLELSEPTSFTAAAAALGVTQSAVSKMVLSLEEQFGLELVSRGRQGCEPSARLKRARPALLRALQSIDEAGNELRRADGALLGKMRIAGFRSATSILLPPAISGFLNRHPDLQVSIATVPETGGGVVERVVQGRADFGVTTSKPPRELQSCHLGSDPYVLVCRKDAHKMDVTSQRLVLWNENCSDRVPEILSFYGWKPKRIMRVDNDLTVLSMIDHGGGFTIMPRLATEPLCGTLKAQPLSDFRRDIWLCGQPLMWASFGGRALRRAVVLGSSHLRE
ncbi:MAG: LysR family transcriptional regulator [Terracidiphilus sp.]|jgi:DNA-binding transcriptional LysR family regulator